MPLLCTRCFEAKEPPLTTSIDDLRKLYANTIALKVQPGYFHFLPSLYISRYFLRCALFPCCEAALEEARKNDVDDAVEVVRTSQRINLTQFRARGNNGAPPIRKYKAPEKSTGKKNVSLFVICGQVDAEPSDEEYDSPQLVILRKRLAALEIGLEQATEQRNSALSSPLTQRDRILPEAVRFDNYEQATEITETIELTQVPH